MDVLNPADWVLVRRADLDALRARANRPAPANGPHLMRVTEVATRLALSRSEVYRLLDTGDLPAVTVGRAVRIHPDDVAAFIHQRRNPCRK